MIKSENIKKRKVERIFIQIIHAIVAVIKNIERFETNIRLKSIILIFDSKEEFLFFRERKWVKIKITVPIANR